MPPDTVYHAQEAPAVVSLMGFEPVETYPARGGTVFHFDHDLTSTLSGHPGSFVYDFKAFGWPAGWSYLGASPNAVALKFNGIPFDDPLTGRPRYDLLPTALLRAPGMGVGVRSMPVAVLTHLRALDTSSPRTELHYQAGDQGLQRVTALHAQQATRQIRGRPTRIQGALAYAGAAAKGEYPGSVLRRMRQLMLRTRIQQTQWALELLYMHNQRRLGAHGGVLSAGDYSSVYNRLIAVTRNQQATRRDVRHDVSALLRARIWGSPLTLQAWHTSARLRYSSSPDSEAEANYSRWGMHMHQRARWGRHQLRVLLDGYLQGSHLRLHVALRDSVEVRSWSLQEEVGFLIADGAVIPGGSAQVSFRRTLFAAIHAVGVVPYDLATQGFGVSAAPLADVPVGRMEQVRIGARAAWGSATAEAFAFAAQERNMVEYYGVRSDSLRVQVQSSPVRVSGIAARVGLRDRTARGFYAHLQGMLATTAGAAPQARKEALPRVSGQARMGIRYALFSDDLRLDLSVRARFWTAMGSRMLHTPTGLLVLPEDPAVYPASGQLPASAAVDVVAEGVVRTAVLFVAYENVTSGTPLMAGNQIVPIYPLPATRLRFGVYWPIPN